LPGDQSPHRRRVRKIAQRSGQYVNAWNGEEFSQSYVDKTGEDQELITVNLSNGASLDVTPYHNFYVKTGDGNRKVEKVRAAELQVGDKLEKFDLPVLTLLLQDCLTHTPQGSSPLREPIQRTGPR
jgi:hypothetical protein